jgi:hypothetical protein
MLSARKKPFCFVSTLLMERLIEFGNLVTGLQHLPEREKIILVALINGHGISENGDARKIECMVAQTIITAARDNQPKSVGENSINVRTA